MKKILNKGNIYFIFLGILLITNILFSLLNLIGLSNTITNVLIMIEMIILFIVMGYFKGKNSYQKGYFQGFKIGILLLLILFVLSLITGNFSLKSLLYYLILLLSSIAGAMLGINKKEDNN